MAIFFSELSGSATSTGSFGSVNIDTSISESSPLTVDGTSGRLLTVTDQMSGSVFSANLISGLPVIEAFSDNKVNIGPFSSPIHIDGSGNLSGSSTSTGSFGRLEASYDGGLQIGNTIKSYYELSGWGLRIQRAASTGFAIKLFPGSGLSYAFMDLLGGVGIFKLDGTEKFRLDSTGINVTSGNVSGSVTSTGSFGYGVIADNLEVNGSRGFSIGRVPNKKRIDTIGSGDNIFRFLKADNSYAGIEAKTLTIAGSGTSTFAGHISGSSTSTGSFGRVEGTKLAAGDNFINSNSLRIQTTSRFFGVSGNSINMTANGSAVTSGAYNIIVGRLNIGHTYSVIDFGRHSVSGISYFRVQHHVSEAGNNPWGILNPQYQILSMFDNSGSLFLNYGDVSGSATSTGSFGKVKSAGGVFEGAGSSKLQIDSNTNISIGGNNDSGTDTTLFGKNAGNSIAAGGFYNTAFGTAAAQDTTTGDRNTAIGSFALYRNVTGGENTAIGADSMGNNSGGTDGGSNTAVGAYSLHDITGGDRNTAVGMAAGANITTGNDNVLIGESSGLTMTTTTSTILIGTDAGTAINSTDANGTIAIGYEAGVNLTSGTGNTLLGYRAARSATDSVTSAIAIGYDAMYSNADSQGNVAIGYFALRDSSGGSSRDYNVAIGYAAMRNATPHISIAIGANAGQFLKDGAVGAIHIGHEAGRHASGSYNVSMGYGALKGTSSAPYATGEKNVAIGSEALRDVTTGGTNVAVGYQSGYELTEGTNNTLVGPYSGYDLTTGTGNTLLGDSADANNATGVNNTIVGYQAGNGSHGNSHNGNAFFGHRAGFTITTGNANVALGQQSSQNITTGIRNTVVGNTAHYRNSTGGYNVVIGYTAGREHIGSNAVLIGNEAGYYATASANTFVGTQAGKGSDSEPYSSGGKNVGIGYQSQLNFTTGNQNTSIGHESLRANSTGANNTALGYRALYGSSGNSTNSNVAVGKESLYSISSGGYNTALGDTALYGMTSGNYSVGIGYQAGYYNIGSQNVLIGYGTGKGSSGNTTGGSNTAVGRESINAVTTGHSNVTMGYRSGYSLTTGYENVLLGTNAAYTTTGLQHAVVIGQNAGYNITTNAEGVVIIGNEAGHALTTGRYNLAIGMNALRSVTTSNYNVAVGEEAGRNHTGGYSTFVGYQAGLNNKVDFNTAIGWAAMAKIGNSAGGGNGEQNVAIGAGAMSGGDDTVANNNGYMNVAVGNSSLGGATRSTDGSAFTANRNVAIGHNAGYNASTAFGNVLVGTYAGQALTTSQGNTFVGYGAGTALTTAEIGSTAIGYQAYSSTTVYGRGVAIGYHAMKDLNRTDQSDYTIAIGYRAAFSATDGILRSVFIGASSGQNANGNYKVHIGFYSGFNSGDGTAQTYLGYWAGAYATGSYNTFVGHDAGKGGNSSEPYSSGENNVAIGYQALLSFTTSNQNVAVGYQALKDVTTGGGNTAVGMLAGHNFTTATANDVFGYNALGSLTAGGRNVAIGQNALSSLTQTGNTDNVAVGHAAGRNLSTTSTTNYVAENVVIGGLANAGDNGNGADALNNVYIGARSGYVATTAKNNTFVGRRTGYALTTGNGNTLLGSNAGDTITTGQNNILIGYGADVDSTAGSNRIGIGYNVSVDTDNRTVIGVPNTDITTILGKVALHGASPGMAMFSHYANRNSSAKYALRQDSNGTTTVNAATGYKILFGINNQYKMTVSGDNVGIGTTGPQALTHIGKFSGGSASAQEILRLTGDYTSLYSGPQIVFTNQHDSGTTPNSGEYNLAGIYAFDADQSWGGGLRFQTSAGTGTGGSALLDRMTILHSGNVGIGTTSPTQKLDIQGSDSAGTFIQIRDTGDDYPVGVTYNHAVGGHHYSWYAGTMDGTSGERKFTISVGVINGFNNTLTDGSLSLLTLSQFDGSTTVTGDLNVSSSVVFTHSGDKKLKFGSNVNDGGVKVTSAVMTVGDIEGSDAIQEVTTTVFGGNKYLKVIEDGVGIDKSPIHPLDVSGTTRTDNIIVTNAITPVSTLVLQSSAASSGQDVNDASRDIYWNSMSTENTTHVDWTAGSDGYFIRFVTAGEYMVYVDLIVTDATANDRMNFFGWVAHMNSSNSIYYSYPLGGSYIRDDSASYDSGGVGGNARLIVAANDRVKVRTQRFDSQDSTDDNPLDTTLSRIRIEKITYGTTA